MDVQLIGAAVNKTWIHAYEGKRSASKRRETRIRDEMLFMFFFFGGGVCIFRSHYAIAFSAELSLLPSSRELEDREEGMFFRAFRCFSDDQVLWEQGIGDHPNPWEPNALNGTHTMEGGRCR